MVWQCNKGNKPLTSLLPPQISLQKLKLLCCNLCRVRWNRSNFKPLFFILSPTFYIIFSSVYVGEGRNWSTVIVVATRLRFGRSGVEIPIRTRDFLVSKRSRPSPEPPPWVGTVGSYPGVKRLRLEVNHPPLCSVEFGNEWNYKCTPFARLHDLGKESVNLCRSFILFVPCIFNSFIFLAPKNAQFYIFYFTTNLLLHILGQ
jgi:hypothetical protein